MKRLAVFLLLAGVGTFALLRAGGGLEGPQRTRSEPVVTEATTPRAATPRIETGKGTPDIDALEGITQPAPPRQVVWIDRLSEERIEIPTFIPWRFKARDARPLKTANTDRQGVLCRDISFHAYREPETRAEAMALVRNESDAYDALLHQRITAKMASVFGRLGEALTQDRAPRKDLHGLGDTELSLSGDVVIHDRTQGLEIHGTQMTVWPEQDRAQGDGLFQLMHEALSLEGHQLLMERDKAKGWSRVSIERDPVLRILAAGRGKDGHPLFNFGESEFRPTTISSSGRAILVRQESRNDVTLSITFSDNVQAEQVGGRSLSAGRAELVAVRTGRPGARRDNAWKLQHFRGEQGVKIAYPGRTAQGGEYLTSVTAQRLLHDVPAEGRASTVLEGDVLIHLRGEIPVLGPGGRMRLMCRDRAWIGPLPAGAPDAGLDRTTLQQISLRGQARIERETAGPTREQDFLEADAIDLVVQPIENEPGTPAAPLSPQARMVAVHFAALGDVLVGGTRIRGATRRLIGDALHTDQPHITAEGEGTRFEFPDLAPNQRLLGPEPTRPTLERADNDVPADTPPQPKGRWVLQRLLARGDVDINTTLGGPALGLPAHLTGDEVSYDHLSQLARLVATAAAPARIAWSASPQHTNEIATRELLLDRSGERITARGGVRGELYVTSGAGERPGMPFPRAAAGQRLEGAVLAVRTDARIDVSLRRGGNSWSAAPGREQLIRIAGPVSTELRAPDNSVDRMRSESLEVALVFELPEAKPDDAPSAPTAHATRRGGPDRTARPSRQQIPFERVDDQAGEVRIDLQDGAIAFVEATGNVDLAREGSHVRGERATYDDRSEQIEVMGTAARPAVVLLGSSDQRSEVQAERLRLRLVAGQAVGLEASSPPGGTSSVSLYRRDRDKPGQLEWFSVTYEGQVTVTNELLRAGRVRVIRRVREPGASSWGEPAVLRSPGLRVIGRRLLTSVEQEREILTIVAEGSPSSPRDEVHFLSGSGDGQVQIWGQRFDFDVMKKEAQLTGLPGRDVTMQRGDGLHSWYTRVTIDMKTNLPSAEGSRILWRPRDKR